MDNREGTAVPQVTFRCRDAGEWLDLTSDDLFTGRSVILFSLPGAFTPTCSSSHLPRYEELADNFRGLGIDEIVCLSVNDGFVMEAWARDQRAERVKVVADGNGEFTEGMGMLVDKSDLGFGKRSWRYAMLVRDGVIEKMFIEPDEPGDPFTVSDADTMLNYLAPDVRPAEPVTLFTRPGCPHCARAKSMLDQQGLVYDEVVVGEQVSNRALRAITGATTVPQIFIGGDHVGGADELANRYQNETKSN